MSESPSALGTRPWLLGSRAQQFLLVLGAIAVSLQCVLLAIVPPAATYETSLVTAYPLLFWVGFGVALGTIVLTFLRSATTDSLYWRHAIVLLFCNYGVFFSLPIARGYKLYGRGNSDSLVHFGNVKTTLATGQIPDSLIYPSEHLLLSALTMTGVPLDATKYLLSFIFTALFVCSIGLLVRQLLESRRRALAVGLCAATPLIFTKFQVSILPAILSTMLFPLVMIVLERHRRTHANRFALLLLTFGFAIVFFHPVTTLFLVILVLSTGGFDRLYERVHNSYVRYVWPGVALVVIPVAFNWYVDFPSTRSRLVRVLRATQESAGASELSQTSEATLTTAQIAMRFVQIYGSVFVYLLLAGLFCLVVLVRVFRRRDTYAESYLAYQFAIGFCIAVAFLGLYLLTYGPIRVSRYLLLIAVLLVALLLYQSVGAEDRIRRAVPVLVALAIVSAAVLGAFAAYTPNKHMTHAEYQGAEFMIEHYDDAHKIRSLSISNKIRGYIAGRGLISPDTEPFEIAGPGYELAPRLGYDRNDTAARSFGRSYLVTQEHDTDSYTAGYYTEAQQDAQLVYNETDIVRMRRDPTVNKIYSNGGFTGWYIPDAAD
jgi:hypothetical protein